MFVIYFNLSKYLSINTIIIFANIKTFCYNFFKSNIGGHFLEK